MTGRSSARATAFALLAALVAAAAAAAAGYETAGPVPAAEYLPAAELSGPEWKVASEAVNDGVFNNYLVESRFGSFPARGRSAVAVRAKEVAALAELDRISKSDVFKDAVKDSAMGSVRAVQSFATQPVETIKAVPAGVNRWLKKTRYQVQETYADTKETVAEVRDGDGEGGDGEGGKKAELVDEGKKAAHAYALDYLNISSAERRWYAELGVDPYTDNEVLREVVKEYSRVGGLTSFGMRFVGLPSIPGAREMRKTMDLVWKTDPWELRRQNREKLLAAGISEAVARDFENSPHLSLTHQVALVGAFEEMAGVEGRQHLLARALDVESREDAAALVQSILLLARHHGGDRPLAAILPGTQAPVGRARSGALVAVVVAEAVVWSEEVAAAVADFAEVYRGQPAEVRELWTTGRVSERFAAETAALGWTVRDRWQPPAG